MGEDLHDEGGSLSQDQWIRDGGGQRWLPSKYKSVVVLWLAVYPAVVIGMTLLRPLVGDLPIAIQALLLTFFVIPLAVLVLIPFMQRRLSSWLQQ
jgi:antibiotic biosynthesis monooxygenase (ABM) superfamily enzyme